MHVCLIGSGCCGIVALLLLAGVALFWVLKSRTRRYPHAEEREDRISELPDEIINLIISRLSAINAARTSVLSRRWRHVYAFTTDIKFPCSCHYYHAGKNLSQSPTMFVRAVDTFLQNHSGSKITSFELVCCFHEHILDSFRNWMNHVGNMGIEQLTIGYTCPEHVQEFKSHVFSSDFLPQASSVKRLCLKGGVFQALNQNYLKDLEMSSVAFTSEEIECILSNCSCLQSLKLTQCVLPSRLCIHGPDLRLKSLTVVCHESN
ncbi:F-box/LRR-repeat protein 25-like [Henckelia pumila]|uniref:F-box/LRR-repeat protein 25-like n=1 Tax=Henckelia pumila TaxID=405737 RepID=UPI003C6DCDDB